MKTIDIIKPDIYDAFQCKGGNCRRTCCAGWKITVNKSEYQDLKAKLKKSGTKILQRLPEKERNALLYGKFVLEDKKGCPLQSDEGLCQLQLSLGAEALPNVCAFFPRQGIRCGEELQVSLTPACERVLELLLERDRPLEFLRQKEELTCMPVMKVSGKEAKNMWNHYVQLQEFCILLLQAQDVSMDHRMALLGLGLHRIDQYYKEKEMHKVPAYMDRYLAMLRDSEDIIAGISSEGVDPAILLGNFAISNTASAGYPEIIKQVMEELKVTIQPKEGSKDVNLTFPKEEYAKRKERFSAFTKRHPYFLENIMVLLFTGKRWGTLPDRNHSIWEQYMYACWVYSNMKFVLTACMREDMEDEELVDICTTLFRSWIHDEGPKKRAIQHFHDTGSDTPAHMTVLVQGG